MDQEQPQKKTKETVTLIAAILAALSSIGNMYFGHWSSMKVEETKWQNARDDDAQKNLRVAVGEFTRELATAAQLSAWMLWNATNDPEKFTDKDISAYDAEMRAIFPKLVSTQVMVAAHDRGTEDRLKPLIREFYDLDTDIAAAARVFRHSREDGMKSLVKCHERAQVYLNTLPSRIADLSGFKAATVSR